MALRIVNKTNKLSNQWLLQAENAINAGNYSSAADILQTALLQKTKDATPYRLLGFALLNLKRLPEALEAAGEAVRLAPFDVASYNLLGVILYTLGDYSLSEKFFRKVLEIDPVHAEAKNSLIACLRNKPRGQEAPSQWAALQELLTLRPEGDAQQLMQHGLAAYERGLLDNARECFVQALEQDPENALLFRYLGMVFMEQGELDKALVAIAHSIRLNPREADGFNMMGVLLNRLQHPGMAKAFFERTLMLAPDHPTAPESLAVLKDAAPSEDPELAPIQELLTLATPTISLCLIAKNEARYLEGCLESVQGAVDEIILVDTGSEDETVEIAKRFGAKIFHYPWTNDFSAARNESIEHATGDWVLILDADERLTAESKELLRKVSFDHRPIGYGLVIDNLLGTDPEHPQEVQTAVIFRFFRNLPDMRYEGAIHEQIIPAAKRSGMPQFECEVRIRHLGYMNKPFVERDKAQRNLAILLKQVEDEPENSYVYFNLGQTYKIAGDYQNAEANYRKSLELLKAQNVPTNAPYYLNLYYNLATLYYQAGQFEKALKTCEESIPIYPEYPDLHYVKGLALTELGRYEDSRASLNQALSLNGKIFAAGSDIGTSSYRAHHALGILCSRLGDRRGAREHFTEAKKTWGNPVADFHIDFGLLAIQEEDYYEALKHLANALETAPTHAKALIASSVAYRGLGLYDDAVILATQAVEGHPDRPEAHLYLAEAYLDQGNYEEGIKAAKQELIVMPGSWAAKQCLGLMHLLRGEIEECRRAWKHHEVMGKRAQCFLDFLEGTVPEDPAVAERWPYFTKHLLIAGRLGMFEKAFEHLDELALRLPSYALSLAQTLLHFKEVDAAVAVLLALREQASDNPNVYFWLGEACLGKNLKEDAELMYTQAVALDPTFHAARRQLLKLHA